MYGRLRSRRKVPRRPPGGGPPPPPGRPGWWPRAAPPWPPSPGIPVGSSPPPRPPPWRPPPPAGPRAGDVHPPRSQPRPRRRPRTPRPPFAAPVVNYLGSTCVKFAPGTWKVTFRWTAVGGAYLDYGPGDPLFQPPIPVVCGTRIWENVLTTGGFWVDPPGSPGPNSAAAYYQRVTTPPGAPGAVNMRVLRADLGEVPITCPPE